MWDGCVGMGLVCIRGCGWGCFRVCAWVSVFVNASKRGHTLVNEQANVDTPPNVDVLGFLLCPGD